MDQNQLLQLMLLVKLMKMKKKKNVEVKSDISDTPSLPSVGRYTKLYESMSYKETHPDAYLLDDISSYMDTESMVNIITSRCAHNILTGDFEYKGNTQPLKDHILEKAEYYGNPLTCHVFDVSKDIKNGIYEVEWNFGSRVPLFCGEVEAIKWISNPIGLDDIEFSLYIHELYAFMWDVVRYSRELYEAAGRDKSYISKVIFTDFKFLVIDGKAICVDLEMKAES